MIPLNKEFENGTIDNLKVFPKNSWSIKSRFFMNIELSRLMQIVIVLLNQMCL